MKRQKNILIGVIVLLLVGILDSAYLTYERAVGYIPPCTVQGLLDCGKVLQSEYAVIMGIPLSLLGLIHYLIFFVMTVLYMRTRVLTYLHILVGQSTVGGLISLYLVYLQIGVLHSICLFCMLSAGVSVSLLPVVLYLYKNYEYQTHDTKDVS